jgi:hypothetical protein
MDGNSGNDYIGYIGYSTGMSIELPGKICGICLTGPFPSTPGLRRHIRQARTCREAAEKDFTSYLENIWSKIPDDARPTTTTTVSSSLTVTLDDDMLDIDLAATCFGQDDADDTGTSHLHRPISPPWAQSLHPHVPVEDAEPDSGISCEYIEPFPSRYKAGAGWKPPNGILTKFDAIRLEQKGNLYAPFNDIDDWKLGMWLVKNVGQRQTEVFLKLPFVSIRHVGENRCLTC